MDICVCDDGDDDDERVYIVYLKAITSICVCLSVCSIYINAVTLLHLYLKNDAHILPNSIL